MPATFSRLKDWVTEVLTPADLNAEFDNILNNLDPSGIGDYSVNAAQMKLQTSPGGLGSESLATSLAGELERLRYVIQRIVGTSTTYWYESPSNSLTDIINNLNLLTYGNRVFSGATTGNSSQLCALIPGTGTGTAASVVLSAATTPLVYYISNVKYQITTNQTISGLSLGPTPTNNTAQVNGNPYASAQQWTQGWGQYGTTIPLQALGSSITPGATYAWQSTAGECFLGYLSTTAAITDTWRGCFFNSTPSAILPGPLTQADTLTLLRTGWIFANTSASLAVSYTNPTISATQPTSPNVGDYWYDMVNNVWKTFNSTTWVSANAVLIGFCAQNTASCIGARTFDSYKQLTGINSMNVVSNTTNSVIQSGRLGQLDVFGTLVQYSTSLPSWSLASHLRTGETATATTVYYLYAKENGSPLISAIAPTQRRDLRGFYFPAETWRCVGSVPTNASTQFTTPIKNFAGGTTPLAQIIDPVSYIVSGNTSIASTYSSIYNMINSTAAAVFTNTASNTWADIATISLTPGVWSLSGMVNVFVSSGTAIGTGIKVAISGDQGTAQAGILLGLNCGETATPNDRGIFFNSTIAGASTSWAQPVTISNYMVQITTASTNYYLKVLAVFQTSSCVLGTLGWSVAAQRIDILNGTPQ